MTESVLDQAWQLFTEEADADYAAVLDRVEIMAGAGLLTEPVIVTKHMPGRHDQRTHTPHIYRGRGAEWKRRGDVEAAYAHLNLDEDVLADMLWVPGAGRYKIWATEHERPEGNTRLNVTAKWWDESGAEMGIANRDFYRDGAGNLEVENTQLGIMQQGTGLGSTLYRNQIRTLRDRGYYRIILDANDTIGRYAWARKGFDFVEVGGYRQSLLKSTNKEFREWVEAGGWTEADIGGWPTFTSAKDIADYDPGPATWMDGSNIDNRSVPADMRMHIGKAFMLDIAGMEPWLGELVLND